MPTDPGPSLERLHQVAETLLAIRSADQLFTAVADGVPGLIEADGAALLIRSDMGDFFQVVAANGRAEAILGRLLPVYGTLVGWVVSQGEGVSTDDMDADSRSHPVDALPADLRVALLVPVAARHATIGALAAF
ncbi:MAG: GAF domain-containing protein, partial [Gemmatimonadales bacterium]